MATRDFSIINHTFQLGSTGAYQEPYDINLATNDLWKNLVIVLPDDGSTKVICYGAFAIPQDFFDTPVVVVVWTANDTTGNAVFDFEYDAVTGNDTESLDQATPPLEAVSVTDAAPSAINERLEATVSLAENFAAGDTVLFSFGIDGSHASTTLGTEAILFDLRFRYADA